MWHVCHLRADSVVWLSHRSSVWPWSGAPKVRLYDTFLGGLHQNVACTGTGISALWFSTSIGTVNYRYWHSTMVPVPVLSFLHFGSVLVKAQSITDSGIRQWCPYWYWHFGTLVQYQYWHGSLLVLALKNPVPIKGICVFLFCTNNNTIIGRLQY